MKNYLSQTNFAKLLKISQAAVSIAVKENRVVRSVKGIDPEHPTNRYFMQQVKIRLLAKIDKETKKRAGKRGRKPKNTLTREQVERDYFDLLGEDMEEEEERLAEKAIPKKKKQKKSSKDNMPDLLGDLDEDDFVRDKTALDLQRTRENVKKLRIGNQEKRNQLIPRTAVRKIFAKLYLIDVNELRTLGDKIATDAAALCGTDDPDSVLAINRLVEKEVFRSLKHIQRIFDDFLREYGAEELKGKMKYVG